MLEAGERAQSSASPGPRGLSVEARQGQEEAVSFFLKKSIAGAQMQGLAHAKQASSTSYAPGSQVRFPSNLLVAVGREGGVAGVLLCETPGI